MKISGINSQASELIVKKGEFFPIVGFKLINAARIMDTEIHYLTNTMITIIVGKNN